MRIYRGLMRRPSFFLSVVLTLMLGIGANSAIFSVIDAVLLKPLPYPSGERLMSLFESNPRTKIPHTGVAPGRLEEWNRMNRSFTAISGAYTENTAETSGALPEKLLEAVVAPRFFSVLGMPPLAGRGFNAAEDRQHGPNSAVISERFWRRRFHGAPDTVGKILRIGTGPASYSIVGIVPASFVFPSDEVDIWVPAQMPDVVMRSRESRFYITVGRVREDVSAASAQADLATVQAQLSTQFPATDTGWSPLVQPLKEQTVGGVRRSLFLLYGAVSLVLLIACANVACLLLAQASRREHEIAIRFSLGARRYRIVRELLLESFCLAVPGAILGLLLSVWAAGLFRQAASRLPRAAEIQLDWRIVLFTLSLAIVTTLLFGLLPALQATRDLARGARSRIGGRQTTLRALTSAQIALAIVLLTGAGLLIHTLSQLARTPLGFDPDRVLAFRVSAGWGETGNMKRVSQRMYRTLEALRGLPGVQGAAIATSPPGGGEEFPMPFQIAGSDSSGAGQKLFADFQSVSPDYFRVLGVPLLSGATCRLSFDAEDPVLVNRSFAERFFPDDNAVGHRIAYGAHPKEIVGVVADVRDHGYGKDPRPAIYSCGLPGYFPDPQYLIKVAGDPLRAAGAVREVMGSIEPNRAVYDVKRLSDSLSSSLAGRRFQTVLLSLFGATALLLAAVGLYGVTTFFVMERTREIGLRTALGAMPRQIMAQIFRQGAVMVLAGIVAGLVAAAVLSRLVANLLYGVAPIDPVTFVGVPLLLVLVTAAATWGPARSATRVDPMEALRSQ
jgi:putative ABC transport system permease protein